MQHDRQPFSFEQHQEVASLLDRVCNELSSLSRDLDESYGSSAASQAIDVVAAIDRVRDDARADRS